MTMKGTAQLSNYKDVPLTVTLTASVGDWQELRQAMRDVQFWPASDFKNAIYDAIDRTVGRVEQIHVVNEPEPRA